MAAVGLVFGVGWAHESLYRRGITEMAFGWLFDGLAMDVSWAINATTTSFYAAGEPRDLQHLLDAMSARLASGPAAVATHKIAAGGETDGVLLRNRWGYRSYGLAAATRYGYATCAPADVRAWLAHIGQETTAQFSAEFDPEPPQLPSVTPLPEPDRTQVATSGFIRIGKGFGLSWLQDRNPTVELAGQIVLSSIERSIPGPGARTRWRSSRRWTTWPATRVPRSTRRSRPRTIGCGAAPATGCRGRRNWRRTPNRSAPRSGPCARPFRCCARRPLRGRSSRWPAVPTGRTRLPAGRSQGAGLPGRKACRPSSGWWSATTDSPTSRPIRGP